MLIKTTHWPLQVMDSGQRVWYKGDLTSIGGTAAPVKKLLEDVFV